MNKVILKKTTIENWKDIMNLEKDSANECFYTYKNEKEYKKYLCENEVFFLIINEKKIGTISYKNETDGTINICGLTVLPDYRKKTLQLIQ